jgi:predicted nucleic acid-binding protein
LIFIDTSVWISAFRESRGAEARELRRLLDEDEAVLSIPVYLEILTGASRADRPRLQRLLSALPVFHPKVETWARIERWIGQATDGGERFGVMDLLVASITTDQEAPLWSLDRDFQRMAGLGFVTLFRPE